ncbi:MAG TPA: hypothetical protein PK431_05045 [Chitinophagales bacterium]|nr:hypothetical protein [Chitinophagales bacterium]
MRELSEQNELVKVIEFRFDEMDEIIIGKIYKIVLTESDYKFRWKINYYCRLEEEFDAYVPGSPYGLTIELAERSLINYVKRFENAVDWKVNNHF